MIYRSAAEIVLDDVFLELPGFVPGRNTYLKLEGLNPAGSIKLKTAAALIRSVRDAGRLDPGFGVIESSSGNLGVALAVVCSTEEIPLTIVTDPNASPMAVSAMEALGANVVVVNERDSNGGFLGTRIRTVQQAVDESGDLVWLNQYANRANAQVHKDVTAAAVAKQFDFVDALFVGAGTTGTLMGCTEFFSEHSPATSVVGVDTEGSVTFGGVAGKRYIPGLGTSRRPELYDDRLDFIRATVPEADTVAMCRLIAERFGLLVGGSTGTVLTALRAHGHSYPENATLVAISPDLGEKYLDSVYSDEWTAMRGLIREAEHDKIH